MLKKVLAIVRPLWMTPAQRRRRLIFWASLIVLGAVIWFLAGRVPQDRP